MAVSDAVDTFHNNHKGISTYQEINRAKSVPVGVDWLLIRAVKESTRQQRSFPEASTGGFRYRQWEEFCHPYP
ncbi:hypothetical protein ACFL6S_20070 [Candidatus Poribacteria bacterium]